MSKLLIALLSLVFIGCTASEVVVKRKVKAKTKVKKGDFTIKLPSKDPGRSQQWALDMVSWKPNKKSDHTVIVAVIDTGVDINHRDISNNLWTNPNEIPDNGIDDDGNGYIDDVHGWNFVYNNNKLKDNHGHGTHIAGIVGAETNNRIGVSGIASNVKIMVIKYYDHDAAGLNNLMNTVKAIEYATKMGAHIINYSSGGLEYSRAEYDAIKKARNKGILFVAAAGNEHSNSDVKKYYPAGYELDNIISVTANDPQKRILASSNYGVKTVDIVAPGLNILSTLPRNNYGYMTGTSQATAFVTGAAAMLASLYPDATYYEIKQTIIFSGKRFKHLKGKARSRSILDIKKAIENMELIKFIKVHDRIDNTV